MDDDIIRDPEETETKTLHELVDFGGQRVLEVGCGEGRLTWRYAHTAAHVTAIDPDADEITVALANRPPELGQKVDFVETSLEDFNLGAGWPPFDVALLSWSL